jgi:Fe2+ transport system protein FeoA
VTVVCALCGFVFEPGGSACRERGCPLARVGCQTVDCPRCGHAVPDERSSILARWVRRLFGGDRVPAPAGRTLAGLAAGQEAIVDRVDAEPGLAARLATQGLVSGARLFLVQRAPSFVVELGETTLAFERRVAARVRLR